MKGEYCSFYYGIYFSYIFWGLLVLVKITFSDKKIFADYYTKLIEIKIMGDADKGAAVSYLMLIFI